jgi:hypothetical protein
MVDLMDWRNPDYAAVFRERIRRLNKIRAQPDLLPALRVYYTANPHDFINDWGVTLDPRNIGTGRPVLMPFVLFPKQREFLLWMMERWQKGEPGIVVKSRDVGATWLAVALACTLSLFHKNFMAGVGSAKELKLDRSGDPDTIFYKARQFVAHLPVEFRGKWEEQKHSLFMRMLFPDTGSSLTGEAGDTIGRGGRKSLFIIDEAAHLERPQLIDAALASTTDCRIDMSSVNGSANPFAQKARGGKIPTFHFLWTDDPRKDMEWFKKKELELDPVTLQQEVLCDFSASQEGICLPAIWVQACVDAHKVLGIEPSGAKRGSLDVADEGADKNAFGIRHGNVLTYAESWTGKESDIYATTERAFMLCDLNKLTGFVYDGDGLGAGVRGDARKINEARVAKKLKPLHVTAYRGSGAVLDPERTVPNTDRKNLDFFENAKAQNFWAMRFRLQATYRAIKGQPYNPDDIISISSDFPELNALVTEMSQPCYGLSKAGKILIEKKPDGSKSPNLCDCVVQLFSLSRPPMIINPALLDPNYVPHAQAPSSARQHARA